MGINVKTGPVTFSYCHVWVPKPNKQGALKFSCCLLIDRTNELDVKAYKQGIIEAMKEGVDKGMFTKEMVRSSIEGLDNPKVNTMIKLPLRDGDYEIEMGKRKKGQGYEGCMFLNANAIGDPEHEFYSPPEITKPLNGKVVAVQDQSEFYSGCVGHAAISFYPFKVDGNRGIAVGLNACFKTASGKRMDGRVSANDEFADFAVNSENLEEDQAKVEKTEDTPSTGTSHPDDDGFFD